jgi:hypothetical protein
MTTREERLAFCKMEALALLEAGNVNAAIASMISDLKKAKEPLYDDATLRLLVVEVLYYRNTPDEVRDWINSFV